MSQSTKSTFSNVQPGYVFVGKTGTKYKALKKIGEGGMGAVYLVEAIESKTRYAIKCEKYKDDHRILNRHGLRVAMEKLVMKSCQHSKHFPRYKDAGRTTRFGWIAMELVGPSLDVLLMEKVKSYQFSVVTCLKIAIQVVEGLHDLHSKGFVHRDLKPANLAIGLGEKSNTIFILDHGLCRQFTSVDGVPLRPRIKCRFKGTRHFAPLAMQTNREYGPVHDLESLFYILALCHCKRLPWSHVDDHESMILCKYECRSKPEKIFDGTDLVPVLSALWNYTIDLGYEDTVDYDYIINYLNAALDRLGGANQKFDWDQ